LTEDFIEVWSECWIMSSMLAKLVEKVTAKKKDLIPITVFLRKREGA